MSQNRPHVLIVDDDRSIRLFLRAALTAQGYTVVEASCGQDAVSSAASDRPDVIILDLGLPDIDGIEVVRLLRQWTRIPIIILSVRGSDDDKVAALDAGANDYLTKPFSIRELVARVRAALRYSSQVHDEPVFTVGILKVDLARRVVMVGDREVQLTRNEYELLRVLVSHAGRVVTQGQLLREVWGPEYGSEIHMLHVNIHNLRAKIEPEPDHPRLIVTEPGVGYRLRDS